MKNHEIRRLFRRAYRCQRYAAAAYATVANLDPRTYNRDPNGIVNMVDAAAMNLPSGITRPSKDTHERHCHGRALLRAGITRRLAISFRLVTNLTLSERLRPAFRDVRYARQLRRTWFVALP